MSNDRPTSDLSPTDIVGAFESFTGSVGDFIANGQPETQIGQAIQARYRAACDAYSNAPSWASGFSPVNRAVLDNMCDPWLDSQGSGGPVLGDPEVTGGQCAGVEYFAGAPGITSPSVVKGRGPVSVSTSKGTLSGRPTFTITFQFGGGLTGGNPVQTGFDDGPSPTRSERYTGIVTSRVDNKPDTCGDGPRPVVPNPNPRPDPGLGPEDVPFEDDKGRPVVPMPPVTDPLGEPVELPNIQLPDLFGKGEDGNATDSPNIAPPVEPAPPQDGNGNAGGDDDFGEPPDGHQWVGFIVKLSDQGLTEGLEVNSPPHPIYKSQTGSYRGKYDVNGQMVYSTPRPIKQETSAYFLELPGLQLTGARVNVPGNDTYTITPLSQPVESSPEE